MFGVFGMAVWFTEAWRGAAYCGVKRPPPSETQQYAAPRRNYAHTQTLEAARKS